MLIGGGVGPVLLMLGLRTTAASTAALLLNLEGLATMAIAWLAFRENVDRRVLIGAFAILAGAALLSWQGGAAGGIGWGALAIGGACLAWGLDNNLTRRLSAADPLQIAMVKGVAAGAVNLGLALVAGNAGLPAAGLALAAGCVGLIGYGVSLVLFVLALRHLGAARTGAYFSTAPFIGAALAVIAFGEAVTVQLALAAALMAVGLVLHLAERHEHEHAHAATEHEHRHAHDEHHRHDHAPGGPARASRIPTGIGTRRSCTSIRTIPTCIIATATRTDEGARPLGNVNRKLILMAGGCHIGRLARFPRRDGEIGWRENTLCHDRIGLRLPGIAVRRGRL